VTNSGNYNTTKKYQVIYGGIFYNIL